LLVPGLDQCARTKTVGNRRWHAGPKQRHSEVARTAHWGIFIPVSLTTVPQCAICAFSRFPNSDGPPPAGSAPSLARASRTLGFVRPRLIASFSCTTISLGVPLFTLKPIQSSTTRLGKPCSTIVG